MFTFEAECLDGECGWTRRVVQAANPVDAMLAIGESDPQLCVFYISLVSAKPRWLDAAYWKAGYLKRHAEQIRITFDAFE